MYFSFNANSSVIHNLIFNFYHYNRVSGIEPAHLWGGGVLPHDNAVQMIRSLLEGNIVVGHHIKNDFRAIEFSCPESDIRDTAYCRVICDRLGVSTTPGLKRLVSVFLADGLPGFQSGAHNPVEDAVASLKLYKTFKANWETIPRSRHPPPPLHLVWVSSSRYGGEQ